MIAIIVALSLSTFILGFAALAVDLGSAYTRKAEVQSIADQLALAGAAGLPDITHPGGAIDRMTRALTQLCLNERTPGLCPADGSAPNLDWATDGDPANGEVNFMTDPDGDTKFSLANTVTNLATPSSALQVVLPPSIVQFGLASALGYSSATIHRSATARVGSPLGRGILPFALTPQDLSTGQFCVASQPNQAYPDPPPADQVGLVTLTSTPNDRVRHSYEVPAVATLTITTGATDLYDVHFFMSNSPTALVATRRGTSLVWDITYPKGASGDTVDLFATGNVGGATGPAFITNAQKVGFVGPLQISNDLCQQQLALNRGFVKLFRPGSTTHPISGLNKNIRSGPLVKLYSGGALASLTNALDCVDEVMHPASACLSPRTGDVFTNYLTTGLLTSDPDGTPGRLIGDCGQGTIETHDVYGVDASDLFTTGQGLMNVNGHGSGDMLRNRLTSANPAAGPGDRGWITSKALRCPRLAVMPVVSENLLPGGIGKSITGFRYVWIDDNVTGMRGLVGNQNPVTDLRGYIVDPGYLPDLVAGSPTVGPLLGGDMPKEALLVTDLTR